MHSRAVTTRYTTVDATIEIATTSATDSEMVYVAPSDLLETVKVRLELSCA